MLTLLSLVLLVALARAVPFEEYILAPASRTLVPASVHQVNGTVDGADSLTLAGSAPGSAVFHDTSAVTFDYGKNIGGIVSLTVGNTSDADQFIGLTYTESSMWISGNGSDSTTGNPLDNVLWIQPQAPGVYTVAPEHVRGGFRYLSLVHNTTGTLEITNVTTNFAAMPHWADDALKNYSGYFHSSDELLNRIWYAGAYTNQLCTIDPHWGDAITHPADDWFFNLTIANGSSALTDGPKRDRLIWPGDMAVAVPSIFVSTNDLITVRNSLDALFLLQDPTTGQLPYASIPISTNVLSATYHLYSLIGAANYQFYSMDTDWVAGLWDQYKLAMNFSLGFVDDSGLMNVTSPNDWLRFGMGGHNIEANAIFYYTLNRSISLAEILGETSMVSIWQATADGIKTAANELLWDAEAGLYRDNETTTLHPQDGNAWAIVSNLTQNASQISSISSQLASRWTAFGAPALEAANAVSPFISSFELQAHVLADNASAAIDLMRLEWGYMLNDPRMTNSTFIEGYSADGTLHYPPYDLDSRISHSHGWATGPTNSLSFHIAGIRLLSPGGQTWAIQPMLGDLTHVEAGFATPLGAFSSNVTMTGEQSGEFEMSFEAPEGTSGSLVVEVPGCAGLLNVTSADGGQKAVDVPESDGPGQVSVESLQGGMWSAVFSCQT